MHCKFAKQSKKMAIEIKRTPVLEGKAAHAFIKSLETKPTVSFDKVRFAISESKKILESSLNKKR